MKRDTLKGRGAPGAGSHPADRRGRLAACLRTLCVVLCCALALQPSLIAPRSGYTRAAVLRAPAAGSASPLPALAARQLAAVASTIVGALRLFAPAAGAAGTAAPGAAAEPEPAAVVFLDAPDDLTVVSATDSLVELSWPAVAGAVGYRVERSPNVLAPYSAVGQPGPNGFQDASVSRGNTYLYRVRAVDAQGVLSPPGPVAMATAVTFADGPLLAAGTPVRAVHVNDLRLAVNGVRRAAGLPAASWGEAVTTCAPGSACVPVRAEHVRELRRVLGEGISALGLPAPAYTDATLKGAPNGTPIRKEHFNELRTRSTKSSGVKGSGLTAYDFASERLDPSNRTGAGGVDPYSGNFNWSLPLVSLPGRAGLDLGLSLTYNSLVWTKSGDYVLFDGDWGWPAPGFRLGFPVVQGKFYDSKAQKSAYLMVTPSGGRVSLRQTATPTVYEAGDSSYLQLTENADGSLTLVAPGGTRMSYWFLGGAYKCTQVRDRNGNLITADYNGYGNLEAVTDTLGRVVGFGYHADGYLKEITQVWRREVETGSTTQTVTETHRWAKFDYEDAAVATNFPGLTVFGPATGQTVHALKRVTLADGSYFTFDYTTWGQVNRVASYAPNSGLLNRVSLDLPANAAQPRDDCPRPTQRRDWAAYRNGDEDGSAAAAEEAVTSYAVSAGAAWQNPETGAQEAGTLAQVTTPDGAVYKEYSRASGWDEGLPRLSEVWGDGARQKWASTKWTQDDEGLAYEQNPRVSETNVYDPEGNRRRTEVVYTSFGLPEDVKEYDSTATTVLRRTHTEYVPASVDPAGAYGARRIIGLLAKREVYGLEGTQEKLFSLVTFEYDLGGEFLAAPEADPALVTQHDETNFGVGFLLRGALCRTRRWDVGSPADPSKSVFTEVGYNTLGSVVFTRDPRRRRTNISYADSDQGTRLAYPTTVTDPAGFTSSTWYNYDMGAAMRTETPKPNEVTDQPGPEVVRLYDAAGRPLKVRRVSDGAYTRWEYGANGFYAKQYTTVDTGQPETFVMSVTDGAGRLRGSLRQLPGGYSAQRFEYDKAGRQFRQYNPILVLPDASDLSNVAAWQPAGEDATSNGGTGWIYAQTAYDWKGRPVLVTAPGSPASTKEFDYEGCGCAGGEVTLTRDEVGRRSRITEDVLGRIVEVQDLDVLDKALPLTDEGDVYRTVLNNYNALEQVTETRSFAGAFESDPAKIQKTTLEYDGHGRLKLRKAPIGSRAVTYEYNADDTLWKVLTPREAAGGGPEDVTTTFTYDSRRLIKRIEYAVPPALSDPAAADYVPSAPPVEMSYDGAGGRIRMTDGMGAADYTYDALGRLKKERRTYSDPANAGITDVAKEINYDYTWGGAIKSVTDPAGSQITYKYDSAGRLTDVIDEAISPYGSVSQYATNIGYRAWGAVKSLIYGNGRTLSQSYDQRLNISRFQIGGLVNMEYRYTTATGGGDDGRVKFAKDLTQINSPFDRAYRYDQAGRLTGALSGTEARGGAAADGPYRETYSYDVWDNMAARTTWNWSEEVGGQVPEIVESSGRKATWDYDAAGHVLRVDENDRRYRWDAAGRMVEMTDRVRRVNNTTVTRRQRRSYDGDGRWVKETKNGATTYNVRSTALGRAVLTELDSSGQKVKTNVYADGQLLARQQNNEVVWTHRTPFGTSEMETASDGGLRLRVELDPANANVGTAPPNTGGGEFEPEPLFPLHGDPTGSTSGILIDGAEMPDYFVSFIIAFGNGRGGEGEGSGVGGQVVLQDTVWIDDWQDFYDPAAPYVTPEGYIGQGAVVARNVGYFVTVPGSKTLQTQVIRRELPKTPWRLLGLIYNNKELLAKINECARTVFGEENAGKLGEQTLSTAPDINATLTSEEIQEKFGMKSAPYGAANLGPTVTHLDLYKRGTIYIGEQYFNNAYDWEPRGPGLAGRSRLENGFVHELGNLLSRRLPPKYSDTAFGKPRPADVPEDKWDIDSGWQFQLCVYGN